MRSLAPCHRECRRSGRSVDPIGAHHRRRGQRHDHRDQDRDRQHHRELAEHPPDQTRHQQDRHEHREQRQAHRDDREGDLARAAQRRLDAAHSGLDMPRHVFEHDNRVIDHKPGRDRQRHQGRVVEAVAEQVHRPERAEQRHRHRDARDQRRPRIAAGTGTRPGSPARPR